MNAAYAGKVLAIETVPSTSGGLAETFATVRIDLVKAHAGKTTELTVGGEAKLGLLDENIQVGDEIVGYTVADPCVGAGCTTSVEERLGLSARVGGDGKVPCGYEGEVHLSTAEVVDLTLDPDCIPKMHQHITAAGGTWDCDDNGGPCSATGAPTRGSVPSAMIVLGLSALAVARRRRSPLRGSRR